MTDRYQVYRKVLKVLKEMMQLSHPGHLVTLAMLIAGIVVSRHAQLSRISSETATPAKDKSTEMRYRRWVKNAHLDPEVLYLPFAQHLLAAVSLHAIMYQGFTPMMYQAFTPIMYHPFTPMMYQ